MTKIEETEKIIEQFRKAPIGIEGEENLFQQGIKKRGDKLKLGRNK